MNRKSGMNAGQVIETMNGMQVVGLDIANGVFQLYTVDMSSGEITNLQLTPGRVLKYFVNRVADVERVFRGVECTANGIDGHVGLSFLWIDALGIQVPITG